MTDLRESPFILCRRWLAQTTWLLLGFFLFFLSFTNAGYFDISDAEERFLALRALLETGSPLITRYWQPTPYAPIYTLGPGISVLPFYGIAELVHRFELSSLPRYQLQVRWVLVGCAFYSALWMSLVAGLARLFTESRRKAVGIALLTGLTTLVLPYSKTFQSENLVGLLVTTCVYSAFKFGRSGEPRWLCWMGAALGAAFSCKNEVALGILPLGIFVIAARRTMGGFQNYRKLLVDFALIFLTALPGIVVVLWYNWLRFGTITASGYGSHKFSHGFLSGMHLQWISAGKGLLWYSPVLIVTLFFIPQFWRKFPREAWLPLMWGLMMTMVYAKWVSPVGDTALGSRFMVSYLPFGVLPLAAIDWARTPRAGKWLAAGLVAISGLLALLFSIVPFVVYQSRRWHSAPDVAVERVRRVTENWYIPDHSPLLGYQNLLKEGLLDIWGIRYGPGEQILVIQPLWWALVGGAISCLIVAWRRAVIEDGAPNRRNRGFVFAIGWVPLFAGCLLGLARVGYPESSTLEVTWQRPEWATHTSRAKGIEFTNTQEDRAFHVLFYEDLSVQWRGKIFVPTKGKYRFQIESQNFVRLEVDGKEVAELSALTEQWAKPRKTWKTIVLEPGWHPFQVRYYQKGMMGELYVRWSPPGTAGWESLTTAQLSGP